MKELICIVCPKGCHLKVEESQMIVNGYSCLRGKEYAISELTNPQRMVTSTVKLISNDLKRLPVVTSKPIPKDKIFEVMNEINKITVKAPIEIGDIIIENILGLNVNIVASRKIEA